MAYGSFGGILVGSLCMCVRMRICVVYNCICTYKYHICDRLNYMNVAELLISMGSESDSSSQDGRDEGRLFFFFFYHECKMLLV